MFADNYSINNNETSNNANFMDSPISCLDPKLHDPPSSPSLTSHFTMETKLEYLTAHEQNTNGTENHPEASKFNGSHYATSLRCENNHDNGAMTDSPINPLDPKLHDPPSPNLTSHFAMETKLEYLTAHEQNNCGSEHLSQVSKIYGSHYATSLRCENTRDKGGMTGLPSTYDSPSISVTYPHPSPSSTPQTTSNAAQATSEDRKTLVMYFGANSEQNKLLMYDLCPVCSDKVSGYHYGLQTCESCKGFFKRSVQNNKKYSCIENQACPIDKTQRKRCAYCRFQKCLFVGMKLEAVRPDRMRGGRNKFGPVYRRDRALRRQLMSQHLEMGFASQLPQFKLNSSQMDLNPSGTSPNFNNNSLMQSTSTMLQDDDIDIKPSIELLSGLLPYSRSSQNLNNSTSQENLTDYLYSDNSRSTSSQIDANHRHAATRMYHGHYDSSNLNQNYNYAVPSSTDTNQQNTYTSYKNYPRPSAVPPMYRATNSSQRHYIDNSIQQPSNVQYRSYSDQELYMNRFPMPTTPNGQTSVTTTSVNLSPVVSYSTTLQLIANLQNNDNRLQESMNKLRQFVDSLLRNLDLTMEELSKLVDGGLQMSLEEEKGRYSIQIFCQMVDQALFYLVSWARRVHFFRDLSVEDQMKLLERCWSEILVLDMVYQQMENPQVNEIAMVTGHIVPLSVIESIGVSTATIDLFLDLVRKLRSLRLDANEYSCLKFIILLNPDVPGLLCQDTVEQFRSEVSSALLDYCNAYNMGNDKVGQLLLLLSEIKEISVSLENYLYDQVKLGNTIESNLLVEILHANRS